MDSAHRLSPSAARGRPTRSDPVPAEGLLHPIALVAIGVLLLNDHVLKAAFPGWLTGKLSDVAGLVFFPLLLQAAVEVVLDRVGRWRGPSVPLLVVCVVATGFVFAAAELVLPVGEAVSVALGISRWPIDVVAAMLQGRPLPALGRAASTADPTDLLALPALAVPLALGIRRARGTFAVATHA